MCLAVPGKIISITEDEFGQKNGKIDFSGIQKEVSLAYVPEARVGDYAIIHVGFALSLVDEAEAKRIFEYLAEMGELDELNAGSEP